MNIRIENLKLALRIAISETEQAEKQSGYRGDSAFLRGIKDVLEAAERGETIRVVE